MARTRLATVAVGLTATLTVTLTACGGSDNGFADKSADAIVSDAKSAMKGLDAVSVQGSVTSDGQTVTLDLQSNSDGDCTGSIGLGKGTVDIVGTGGDTWFRADDAFWRDQSGQASQIIKLVGGKWVVDQGSFDQFCDLDQLLDNLITGEDGGSTYTKKGTDTVAGDDVVRIDDKQADGTSSGYVLLDDPHYLVKVEKTEGQDTGTVTFSDFDKDFDVDAPSDDEVVDLSKLGSAG